MEASWDALMSQAASMPNVLETCSQDEREKQVKSLLSKLEDLQVYALASSPLMSLLEC